jgi:hypothetical protein
MSDEDLILPEYDECAIEIHAAEGGGYIASVLLADGSCYPGQAAVNLDELSASLLEMAQDPLAYGEKLYKTFLDGPPKEGLAVARTRARDARRGLRLCLDIPPDARRLHILNWEWLYDPVSRVPFAASPDYAVSRFLAPTGHAVGAPVKIQPLRVLVIISNPSNLEEKYGLQPLDPRVEHDRMAEALAKVAGQVEWIFLPGHATVENIRNQLEREAFHVVHVMAHGYFKQKGSLMLEDAEGQAQPVDENVFGDVLLGQPQVRLVVLAACLSAARSQASAFAGLAPALAARGVPAVVAMQGRIEIGAAQAFVERFYRHLGRYGRVDAAVNYARYHLLLDPRRRDAGDWGTPVLFMNTARGELFYPAPVEVGAYLPESYRHRLLPVLKEFVDRKPQQDLVHAMIQGDQVERILCVQGILGMGKSWFIERSVAWCIERGILWRSIDFQVQPDKPWDYLTVVDELLLPDQDAFNEYRTLLAQTTLGGMERERAFAHEKQRDLTRAFVLGLTRLPAGTRLVYFLDQHTDAQAPEPVQRWLWDVFLPFFQGRRLPLGHVTVVLSSPTAQATLDDRAWYHTLARTRLEPLTREHFVEYARARGVRDKSDDMLCAMYDAVAAFAGTFQEAELTPLRLSLTVDKLKQQRSAGG